MRTILFQPPRAFEERKPFAYSGAQRGKVASAFGGLGDAFKDILDHIQTAAETVLGSKQQEDARAQALQLAQTQAAAEVAQTQARTALLKSAAPWIGLAVVGAIVAVVLVKR